MNQRLAQILGYPHALLDRLLSIFLSVVFFVQDDPSQGRVDPGWPQMETGMCLFAVIEKLVPVKRHNRCRHGMTELEGEHRHFEEFSLRLLPLIVAFGAWASTDHSLSLVHFLIRVATEGAHLAH